MQLLETLGALGGSALLGAGGSLLQNKLGKDNLQYQWDEMYSPQAQVRNLAKAGINPAVAFGNNSPTFSSGGQLQMPSAPDFGIGTTAINELGNYFKSLADAKKAGADTKYVGAMTDKALTEIEAQKMQNEFNKRYGNQKWLNDLSLSYQNVLLAQKTNDLKEIEKAIGKWKEASEKAISEANEHQRDMLVKDLANKDEQIRLSNNLLKEKANTEKSAQSANYANAAHSNELANTEKALRSGRITAQTLENGLKAIDFNIKNVTEAETEQQIKDEAARIHKMLLKGDVLGKWLPQMEGYEIKIPVLSDIEDACRELWYQYKAGVKIGEQKVKSHKN